jgi:hypothetical protein
VASGRLIFSDFRKWPVYPAFRDNISTNCHRLPTATKLQIVTAIQNPRGSDTRTRLRFPKVKGNLPARNAENKMFAGIINKQNLPTRRNPNIHVAAANAIRTIAVIKVAREMMDEVSTELD